MEVIMLKTATFIRTGLLLIFILLSGCSTETLSENNVPGPTEIDSPLPPSPTSEVDSIEVIEQPTEATQAVVTPQSSETTSTPATRAVVSERTGLVASDPTTVLLSSGRVQLVEFFAFW
jgi:hypothetical protein